MVYLTEGYLGALPTIYTMRNYNGLPDLWMDVDHQRLVWLSAPRLTSARLTHQRLSLSDLPLTSHTCVTDRSEANQCLLLLKVPGDTNTPLYQRSQGIPTLPLLCGGRPLCQRPSKDIPTLLISHKSTPGDTNTPVNTAERLTLTQRQPYRFCRTYRLFSFRLTLHTEDSLSGRQQERSFNDRSDITALLQTPHTSLFHRFNIWL